MLIKEAKLAIMNLTEPINLIGLINSKKEQ